MNVPIPGRLVSVIMMTGVSPTNRIGTTIGIAPDPPKPQQSILALNRHKSSPTFSTLEIS